MKRTIEMNKNHENFWKNFDGKTKDGYGTILVKFGEVYFPVLARPLDPNDLILEDAEETKRLNLTLWEYKTHPLLKSIKKCNVSGEAELYFNGSECCWKFYENSPWIELSDVQIDKIDDLIEHLKSGCSEWYEFYEPHNDYAGNYGDESVHAVYDIDLIGVDRHYRGEGNKSKISIFDEMITEAKDCLDQIFNDLHYKKLNHKKLEVDEDLLNDLKGIVFEFEYTN